jgi:hypothetical protein
LEGQMTAQILAIAFGFAAAGLMAHYDYRQSRNAESVLGAVLTFGLFTSVVLAVGGSV